MYLEAEAPEGRAVRGLLIVHEDSPGVHASQRRPRELARRRIDALLERLRAGEDFDTLARKESDHASARYAGVIGTVWPGMLSAEMDAFLFAAEVGEISDVIESPAGYHVLQRIERDVAWRHIRVEGTDEAARRRARELLARLVAGEDFVELAREHCSDPLTAERGGVVGILERGPRDALLKAAAFEAPFGRAIGPLDAPNALYLLERLDPATVDPDLRELTVVRARGILIGFTGAKGASPELARTSQEAEALAHVLAERIRAGEDMAELAAEHTDDPTGRARRGDLGWILRYSSDTPAFLERLWNAPLGELQGPLPSNAGWVLFRRER
ncbi:MAG TPA: peptidylprolyl isomerase [Planctomycetota bacterium]|nr:peptidylprolyl isomerase [Planctomycetota bacterium]